MWIPLLVSGFFHHILTGAEALALLLVCSSPFHLSTPICVSVRLLMVETWVVFPSWFVSEAAMNTLRCVFWRTHAVIALGCFAVSEVSLVFRALVLPVLVSCVMGMCHLGGMISDGKTYPS